MNVIIKLKMPHEPTPLERIARDICGIDEKVIEMTNKRHGIDYSFKSNVVARPEFTAEYSARRMPIGFNRAHYSNYDNRPERQDLTIRDGDRQVLRLYRNDQGPEFYYLAPLTRQVFNHLPAYRQLDISRTRNELKRRGIRQDRQNIDIPVQGLTEFVNGIIRDYKR